MNLWLEIFVVLELDRKAQCELMLLAHSGEVGRAEANEVLWEILSAWALDHEYLDLSSKVSSLVKRARRNFDRPPRDHRDREWWSWECLRVPRHPHFGPRGAPRWGEFAIARGPRGEPLPPPNCWVVARPASPWQTQ